MNVERLVQMANQIGDFFESMPDRQQALADIVGHIKKSWDPRMRRALLQHIDEEGGTDLSDIVRLAIQHHKAVIQ